MKAASCGATPVAKQYELGEQMGVRGTPAIFTATATTSAAICRRSSCSKQLE